jgi:thiol-disulfide isomerase/thioredoxin
MRVHASFVATLCLVVAGCGADSDSRRPSFRPLGPGDAVPTYTGVTVSGESVTVGGEGPVTLLNLWATWCVPCRTEFPDLQEIHEELGPRGLRLIAVSLDQGGTDRVMEFVNEMEATFAIVHDREGAIEDVYRTVGLPNTYLVDAEGKLVRSWLGPLPKGTLEVIAQVLDGSAQED